MTLLVITIFIAAMTSVAMGAINPPLDRTDERWYSVDDEEQPFVQGEIFAREGGPWLWEGSYYLNDQTFFLLSHSNEITYCSGSYLWESGFFLGIGYDDVHGVDAKAWEYSPGYRWNLDRGYLALSLNYQRESINHSEYSKSKANLKGIEATWIYYPENMKIRTNLQWDRRETSIEHFENELYVDDRYSNVSYSVNYKIGDNLVVGIGGLYEDMKYNRDVKDVGIIIRSSLYDYNYNVGFTWDPKLFILNGTYEWRRNDDRTIDAGLYIPFLKDFQFGVEYWRVDYQYGDYDEMSYSLKYLFSEDSALLLGFRPEFEEWTLVYNRSL